MKYMEFEDSDRSHSDFCLLMQLARQMQTPGVTHFYRN